MAAVWFCCFLLSETRRLVSLRWAVVAMVLSYKHLYNIGEEKQLMKRGQVSYFIFVAILLLLVMVALLYVSSQGRIDVATQGASISVLPAIENFVQSCVNLVATKGIYHIAYQGGYINSQGDSRYGESGDGQFNQHYTYDTALPYAVDGDKLMLRPLLDVQTMLEHYVLVNLPGCLDFSNFEAQGLVVKQPDLNFALIGFDPANTRVDYAEDPVSVTADITSEFVTFDVVYPILVRSTQGEALLTRSVTRLDFRLGTLHAITASILSEAHEYNPYDLAQHCKKFGAKDGLINVYLDQGVYYQAHALSVVDAAPLAQGFTPLRFQVGVLNQNMTGVCKG